MRERRRRKQPLRKKAKPWQIYLAGAIVALIAVSLVIIIGAVSRNTGAGFVETITVASPRPSGVPQDGHTFGSPDAPATIDEYLDFQCPFCRRAAMDVLPTIEAQYIASGKAKLVIHPIAILGSESIQAAAAAECANDQGQFWRYHDMLYANQGAENSGAFSAKRLKAFASDAGLDTNAFNGCLDAGTYTNLVEQNTASARASGITSTPTLLVNGSRVNATIPDLSAAILAVSGD
jgi:protein-disulfide isomerase